MQTNRRFPCRIPHGKRMIGCMPRRTITAAFALGLLIPLAPTPAHAAVPASPRSAASVLATMSLRQEVGQLLMLGTSSSTVPARTAALLRQYGVGSVVLLGTTHAGVAGVATVTRGLQARAAVPLLVAADQEGGAVQHLQGPGLSRMPSALTMGGWSPAKVRARAKVWAGQLRRAGVNLDLAPVLDTVPRANRHANQPIGRYDREFGFTPARVASRGVAFARGLADGGLSATAKHFPGLGRVRGNTDVSSGVTDHTTTMTDRYLQPFRAAIAAHVPVVMVSTAIYARIDPHTPAVFSRTIITTLLRRRLGFGGVVVSDTLSGAQLATTGPARRAVRFVKAGGDLALTTTPGDIPAMSDALVARARRSSSFRSLVDAAALRVLKAKRAQGLL
jgi:beta-N-acetylhexosaminidase